MTATVITSEPNPNKQTVLFHCNDCGSEQTALRYHLPHGWEHYKDGNNHAHRCPLHAQLHATAVRQLSIDQLDPRDRSEIDEYRGEVMGDIFTHLKQRQAAAEEKEKAKFERKPSSAHQLLYGPRG